MNTQKDTAGTDSMRSGLIRWAVVAALLVFVFCWKKEEIYEAAGEIRHLPVTTVMICLVLAIMYFVFEGGVIMLISTENGRRLRFNQAFGCSLYHAFYKFVSLGVISGIAEVFYLHSEGISLGKSTGMSLIRYTLLRIATALIGVAGTVILAVNGHARLHSLRVFVILGMLVSLVIAFMMFAISFSHRFAVAVKRFAGFVFKKNPGRRDKVCVQIDRFNEAGKSTWRNKTEIVCGIVLSLLQLLCWNAIPAVIFASRFEVDFPECISVMTVVNMLGAVMIAPAGVGTLEYLFSLFYSGVYGVMSTAALILYRFFTMVAPCIPGIAAVLTHGRAEVITGKEEAIEKRY
ncbi:MAG: flippase-like domain-containing protein [Lachnospiraceae bacterium]|nr:flippase-like domain-containing protein [Lachnospiraceae bacterium]